MTNDIRPAIDDTPVEGIDSRVDQLLNERFRSLAVALIQLQQRTIIEPRAVAPLRAYNGQIELADGVNWSPDGTGQPGLYYYWQGEWHAILDDQPAKGHMHWHGGWSAGYYYPNSVVYDDGWTMICRDPAGCTDRPAPQPIGAVETELPDTPAWNENTNLGVVWSGHEYTMLKSGWVQGVSVWAPELLESTNYRIIITDITDPDNIQITTIEEPVLNEDAWTLIALGATPYPSGSKLQVILDAFNGGDSTPILGGWTRGPDENAAEPPAQSWNVRTQDDTLRIDFTDLDSGNRQTELESIIPGSQIQLVATTNALQSVTYEVNSTTTGVSSVIYGVVRSTTGPLGMPPVGVDCQMTADVPVPQTTRYKELIGHWPANDPSFATMRGLLRLSGVTQPADTNAYGVRIHFQEADVSQQWEMVAYTDLNQGQAAVSQDDIDTIIDMIGGP